MAAGHEVHELLERNTGSLTELLVGLPHGLHRPPLSAAEMAYSEFSERIRSVPGATP